MSASAASSFKVACSSTTTIEQFYIGMSLFIPAYQRDFVWIERNADDLLSNVAEALEGPRGHFPVSQPPRRTAGKDGHRWQFPGVVCQRNQSITCQIFTSIASRELRRLNVVHMHAEVTRMLGFGARSDHQSHSKFNSERVFSV
jgi:hypothetical protein